MIDKRFAEKFIDRVTRYTEYNVNIMDERGIIIASRDKSRIGQYHEIAHRLLTGTEEMIDTTGMSFANVLPGINMVIAVSGVREGVVGVTGTPDEVRPVALMVKMAFETTLKYERQQEQERLRANRKEHFVHLLTQVEHTDPEELRSYARDLGYPEAAVRAPILLCLENGETETALRLLRESPLHSRRDFSIVVDSHHVLVFKTAPIEQEESFSGFRNGMVEYLEQVYSWQNRTGQRVSVYIGSFQASYPQYYYGYQHCKWLERTIPAPERSPVFFYDHFGEYFQSVLPLGELQHAFYVHLQHIPPDKLRSFREIVGALIASNYNFTTAAKQLYLHKNTLVYRYNNIKSLFGADPMASAEDRALLEGFYRYLTRIDGQY